MNEELEDFAFYESGLSADGCLEKLDDYTRKAIENYGRILLEKQKQNFIDGFQGCCYCCEPVGLLNQELERERDKAQEDATNYYAKIGELFEERDKTQELADQYKEMFDMQTKIVVDLEMRLIKMEEQLKP